MPYGNRMGPWGAGPMTGRGAGYCAGFDAPGYMNPFPGSGWGRGRGGGFGGGGRGWRHRFWATGLPGWAPENWFANPFMEPYPGYPTREMTREQEIQILSAQAKQFEESLKELRKRIAELEAQDNA